MSGAAKSIVCVLCTFLLAGCASTGGDHASVSYAAPSNYRQLVARKVIEGTAHLGPIRSATISQPGEKFMGLVNGGSRPIVCARTIHDGRLIPHGTGWLFMFENGQIAQAIVEPPSPVGLPIALYCVGLQEGPFPEAVKAR